MYKILLYLINKIHKILIYFWGFGFMLPKKYLTYHLPWFPLIIMHWLTNDNYCFITDLEEYLVYKIMSKKNYDLNNNFPKSGFQQFFDFLYGEYNHPSLKKKTIIVILIYGLSWVISFYKYNYT